MKACNYLITRVLTLTKEQCYFCSSQFNVTIMQLLLKKQTSLIRYLRFQVSRLFTGVTVLWLYWKHMELIEAD